jgi:hypothetical protein
MSTAAVYRANAETYLELARQAKDTKTKITWLGLAQAWFTRVLELERESTAAWEASHEGAETGPDQRQRA